MLNLRVYRLLMPEPKFYVSVERSDRVDGVSLMCRWFEINLSWR